MAIDFNARDFCYPLTILRLHRILVRSQWFSPAELRSFQDKRLRATIRHAYQDVPYYRELFDRQGIDPRDVEGASDLVRLPLLSKRAARSAGAQLRSGCAFRYLPKAHSTSGTTGEPLEFLLDKDSNALEFVYYWRHWSWAGYRLGDRFAELSTNHFLHRPELRAAPCHWQSWLRRLVLDGGRVSKRDAAVMAAAIRRHRPRYIKGLASTLFFFARCLDEAGIRDISFKAAFSTGEVLSEACRALISSTLRCPVLDSYGHMERTAAICQCPEGGYHVNADYGVLEILDRQPTDRAGVVAGRAVGTSLYNRAMPLIRFDIGDIIEVPSEPRSCPCGRSLPLVEAIRGRVQDIIVTPEGRYITAIFILPEFVTGIGLAQFVQESADKLTILVVPSAGWNPAQQDRLAGYASRLLGPSMQVEIRTVTPTDIATDASGKRKVVISDVPQPERI